jgi:hypothetical protein
MTFEERRAIFLDRVAALPLQPPVRVWYTNSGFLSCLATNKLERANELIREKADLCITFTSDCSDFLLNLLLRGLILYPDRITADNKDRIKKAAVGGRYYGGHRRNYPMFYNSENHHMNWATAEFLAAQLFPDEIFTFDRRTARAHYDRARFLVANWIDRRARWGYCEWNSSPYMGINLMSLLNLADFARDPAIRQLATDAVTKLLADLAADSLAGGVWSAQARAYEPHVFNGYDQPAATALVLLLGAGDPARLEVTGGVGEIVATTAYKAPAWLCRLAADPSVPLRNEERHRAESDLFYTCRSAFWRPPYELTNEEARQQFCPDSLEDIAVRTERTRHYLVSASMLPPGRRKLDAQALYWMGSLRGVIPILTTQPFRPEVDRAGERYWAGTSSTPRCFLHDGVVAAVYEGGDQSLDFTHAHFPTPDLDEWARSGRWFFGRSGDAFVGVRAPEGAELTGDGPWAGREIKAPGKRAAWLVAFSSKRDRDAVGTPGSPGNRDADFPGFQARCLALPVLEEADRSAIEWTSGGTRIRVSQAEGASLNGKPFSCAQWPQLNNPVVRHEYGSAITEITPPGEPASTLNFAAARAICAEWERQD